MSESAEFLKGRESEDLVFDLLTRSGWYIVDTRDFCDNHKYAPRLRGVGGEFIAALPDFYIVRRHESRWVEVKTKDQCLLYRKWGKIAAFMPLNSWNSYQIIKQESGIEAFFVFHERNTNDLIVSPFSTLEQPENHRINTDENPINEGGDIYFDKSKFYSLAKCNSREIGTLDRKTFTVTYFYWCPQEPPYE